MRDVFELTKLAGPLAVWQLPRRVRVHHAGSVQSNFLKTVFQVAIGAFFKSEFGERIDESADSYRDRSFAIEKPKPQIVDFSDS